jgi:radical SAM superfamily enzyme YgiQ (UPF0313 family)
MNILLIRPPRIKQAITLSDFMFSEPLGLEMIYGVIKENYTVEIFDMMIENMSLSEKIRINKVDIIGVTSLCIDVNMVKELCKEVKKEDKNIITFIGGTQTYLNPEAFIDWNIDYIFEYTNKENLNIFCSLLEKGLEVENIDGILSKNTGYKSTGIEMRNEYLFPDREATKKYRDKYSYFGYRPAAIMEFGMGCNKLCNFCLRWRIEGAKEKLIDLELTKRDLIQIKEPTIMFIDNDFFANREKIESFVNIAKELNLKKNYIVYGSVKGIIEYEDLIKDFVDLGLKAILVGYESFDDKEMNDYNKKSTTSDNYKAAQILKSLGVDVWASFIAHPDWSKKDFKFMRKYIKKLEPEISSINPLTPFPNLPMYKEYFDRLLYEKEDYEKWSFGQVIISPSNMSLKSYYYELLKTNLYVNLFINKKTDMIKHYGIKNIFRILFGSLTAMKKYIVLMLES